MNYDFKRPTIENITYGNNQAPYGPDIASYPVKIRFQGSNSDDMVLNDVGSGILYPNTLSLALMDYDNQVMVLNNENQILITPVDPTNSSMQGFNAALLQQGVASFDNLIAIATPGQSGVEYRASSNAIDMALINSAFGSQISDNLITVNFRFCKPGEQQYSDTECRE